MADENHPGPGHDAEEDQRAAVLEADGAFTSPMTLEEAFKRAVFWMGLLCSVCDIDPDTNITFTAETKDGASKKLVEMHLGNDCERFMAMGAEAQFNLGSSLAKHVDLDA